MYVSPSACSSQGRARLKPISQEFYLDLPCGWLGPHMLGLRSPACQALVSEKARSEVQQLGLTVAALPQSASVPSCSLNLCCSSCPCLCLVYLHGQRRWRSIFLWKQFCILGGSSQACFKCNSNFLLAVFISHVSFMLLPLHNSVWFSFAHACFHLFFHLPLSQRAM